MVSFVSIIAEVYTFKDKAHEYYISQKNNVFNIYGTKLGWLWTSLIFSPFIFLVSYDLHRSKVKAFASLYRILIATIIWYCTTAIFIIIERYTSTCDGFEGHPSRSSCVENGGKWISGFDISGHCFMLVFANLIMNEEALNLFNNAKGRESHEMKFKQNHKSRRNAIHYLFLSMFFLSLLWDFQIIITSIYYHTVSHKLIGALLAVIFWSIYKYCNELLKFPCATQKKYK